MPDVSLVLCYNAQGHILLGRRNDGTGHTLPGGHAEGAEKPAACARRELKEETGLDAVSLTKVSTRPLPGGGKLHVFSALVEGFPHGHLDPDREVTTWTFHPVADGLDPAVRAQLSGPPGDDNVVRAQHPAAPEPWKTPLDQTCPHGLRVVLVDGEHVRDHFDSDFVQGGNPERYSWIPKGELWLDASMPPAERHLVLEHECREAEAMAHGEPYGEAHDAAKGKEDAERHADPAEMAKAEELEKGAMARLHPFDPQQAKAAPGGEHQWRYEAPEQVTTGRNVGIWSGGDHQARERLAERIPSPAEHQRTMHRLHGLTQVRRGPAGREVLLHRGVGADEHRQAIPPTDIHYTTSEATSWSPSWKAARQFTDHDDGVVSAWMPEHAVRAYLPILGSMQTSSKLPAPGPPDPQIQREQEVVVPAGKYELHRAPPPAVKAEPKHGVLAKDEEPTGSEHHTQGAPPALKDHVLFHPQHTVGLISGESPRGPSAPGGHEALRADLTAMGLHHEETMGNYGGPERSFIVHDPTREQMTSLGTKYGQESVVWGKGGQHQLIYTHGEHAGLYHPSLPRVRHSVEAPQDYYTALPGGQGHVTLYFDHDRMLPSPAGGPTTVSKSDHTTHEEMQAGRTDNIPKAKVPAGKCGALYAGHPHIYCDLPAGHDQKVKNPVHKYVGAKDFEKSDGTAPPYVHPGDELLEVRPTKHGLLVRSPAGMLRRSEGLTKMAIRDIAVGREMEPGVHDYSHVLTPEHRAAGYALQVTQNPETGNLRANLSHEGYHVGHIDGMVDDVGGTQTVSPHVELDESHRGRGLGTSMYEALYTHAYHDGIRHVLGSPHTDAAGLVHERLAQKHGLRYRPGPPEEDYPSYDRGRHHYELKSEPMAKGDSLSVPYRHARSAVPTPNMGERFGQHLEPTGKYLSMHNPAWGTPSTMGAGLTQGWYEYGKVNFKNPVVHQMAPDESPIDWKAHLSQAHGGRTGRILSDHLRKLGHDGVVVRDHTGEIGEMVSLGAREEVTHPMPVDAPVRKTEEQVADPLAKTHPTPTFPAMGLGDDRRETPIVDTVQQVRLRVGLQDAAQAKHFADTGRASPEKVQQFRDYSKKRGAAISAGSRSPYEVGVGAVAGAPGSNASYALASNLRPQWSAVHQSTNAPLATKLHEDYHQMMRRVQAKHGIWTRRRLNQRLVESLPPAQGKAVLDLAHWRGYEPDSPNFHEEGVALLHNYLNNPAEREKYHSDKAEAGSGERDPALERARDSMFKDAHKRIRAHAARVTLEDTLPSPEAQARIDASWGKSEPAPEDGVEDCREPRLADLVADRGAAGMLAHHDPRERALAAVAGRLTHREMRRALLDPDPEVRAAAASRADLHPHTRREAGLDDGLGLTKALGDVPVGPQAGSQFDYSHVLTPEHRAAGYVLHVAEAARTGPHDVDLYSRLTRNGEYIGSVGSSLRSNHHGWGEPQPHQATVRVGNSIVGEGSRGKGLGTAMYEALLAHAKNKNGATHVAGGEHSSMASRVHEALARKHGMHYEPNRSGPVVPPSKQGPFDSALGDYQYELKAEPSTAADEDLAKMAVIHDDPQKPMTVYRVQDEEGNGPYKTPSHTPYPSVVEQHAARRWTEQPNPKQDFSMEDKQAMHGPYGGPGYYGQHRFGFESPEHATSWFGKDNLAGMAQHGYHLVPVQARRVYRSQSGKQVAYLPHEGTIKSEDLEKKVPGAPKVFRTNSGWGDDVSIPSMNHPDRPAYDANHRAALVQYFAGGDAKALKPVKVPLTHLDASHAALGSPDRKALYARMARQDRLPPIVVSRQGSRFQVVDGNHRHEAARAAGLTHLDAFEVVRPKGRV